MSVCLWVTFCLSLIGENWIRIRVERRSKARQWETSKCSESWPDDPRSAPVGRHKIYVVVRKRKWVVLFQQKKTLTYEVGTENSKLNSTVRLCLGALLKGYLYLSHLHILANKMEFVFDICCEARRGRLQRLPSGIVVVSQANNCSTVPNLFPLFLEIWNLIADSHYPFGNSRKREKFC